ncbi:MAG: hypothetical protein IPL42_01620 [Saprospiraceae bacterium]|nr:hypothetical protein [Saprospiraceae bacterium]
MKKQLKNLVFTALLLVIKLHFLQTQCSPPMSEECNQVNVLCSLDELNGYACNNTSTVPSHCGPLCSQGGIGENTSWWGFVTEGGNVTMTLTIGSCNTGQGLQFGIWGDCLCEEEIVCRSNPCSIPNSVNTVSANLQPCKTYYFWIDGCNGDFCDFTISTSGGAAPTLSPLGKINNKANMILEPICEGACDVLFFVNPQGGGCKPQYVWTLDGNEVGGNINEIRLDLPDPGDFILCVTAYIGNPQNGSVCAQQGPQCATLKVRQIQNKIGLPRILCKEQTNVSGYKWHSLRIKESGIYSEQFSDANCCKFDSIVEFIVLEPPIPEAVYYLTCNNTPYTDAAGKKHQPCLFQSEIALPKITNPYRCDSSILLTAVNVDFAPSWDIHCFNAKVELIPNLSILKPCNAGEIYEFEYRWFKKSDPLNILSTDERLFVNPVSEDYCLQVIVKTTLENKTAICTKIFCETLQEGSLNPECSFTLNSSKIFCFDSIGTYWIDSFLPKKANFYTWTIDGGFIVSNPDSSVVNVKWLLNSRDTGKVCVSYDTDCGTSCEKCIDVIPDTKIAGQDFEKRGLSAYLDAKANPNGSWRFLSGPHKVTILEPNNPRTKFIAFNYGVYCFEWTINDPNCIVKDTLCVNLHSFKKASPKYPDLIFEERAGSISDQNGMQNILFTPNLIENNGVSFVTTNVAINSIINYSWIDIYGRTIHQEKKLLEPGIQRVNINSPMSSGMYFLVIEINGEHSISKVCVLD